MRGWWLRRAALWVGAVVCLALLAEPLRPVLADPVDRTAPAVLAPVGAAPLGAALAPDLVAGAIGPMLRGGALGPGRTPVHVLDVASGQVVLARADRPAVPASTMKLVTAASVLDALGPDVTLETRAVLQAPDATVPRVVVVGAGDPSLRSTGRRVGGTGTSLAPSSLQELADRTARALSAKGLARVRVGFDDSLFTGPALHPSWSPSFPAAGVVAPVSALQVDQGRPSPSAFSRVGDPALSAAERFAALLEQAGVTVSGQVRRRAPAARAVPLAAVSSPTIGVLVERTLAASDNDYAEALGRLGALASGEPASFEGVGARAAELMAALGIPTEGDRFADASGLSRDNRLRPSTVTALLRASVDRFGEISSGLPVAGATGSLGDRFQVEPTLAGRGVVRAKTGTLTGVIGLAGFASRPDGRLLAFAILDGSVPGGALEGRAQVDAAVAALVECPCEVPGAG